MDVPLMSDIPKGEASLFSKIWGGLLFEAVQKASPDAWFDFFSFPKCILLAPVRGGRRISKRKKQADLVHERLTMWTEKRKELWEAVVARGGRRPNVVAHRESPLEKRVMKAIRMGDVRKALQLFTAAPFAPKNAETLEKLKALHPDARFPMSPRLSRSRRRLISTRK